MDMYAIRNLRGKTPRQLKESRAEIVAEIATLESKPTLSSVEDRGLGNLRASLDYCDDQLDAVGQDGVLTIKTEPPRHSPKYMTYETSDGKRVYGVGAGQKFTDIPTAKATEDPFAIGQFIRAAVSGERANVSPEVRAALDSQSSSGYNIPSVLSSSVIDLARNESVMTQAGMPTIDMTSDNLTIARVLTDPTFDTKLENKEFSESTMTFGAIAVSAKMVGCLLRCSMEVIMDAPNFPQIITETLSKAFAVSIDQTALTSNAEPTRPSGFFSYSEVATTDFSPATALSWNRVNTAYLAARLRNHRPTVAAMRIEDENALLMETTDNGEWRPAPPSLQGVRTLGSSNMPADKFIVGDFSKFALCIRNGFQISFTDDGAGAFEKNQRVFRCYWRGNFAMLDSTAFQIGALAAA